MPKGSSGKLSAAQRIAAMEATIARNDFETAMLFDDKSRLIFEKVGGKNEVGFTAQEASLFKGKILTHNHPFNAQMEAYGIMNTSAFSSTDLALAYRRGLKEIRMVIGNETHSFRWKNPNTVLANRFINELKNLESDANVSISKMAKSADNAIKRFTKSPTRENSIKAESTIKKYYTTIHNEVNKINKYFSINQGVGYEYEKR